MFVQRVALEAIPPYAQVAPSVLTSVLSRMLGDPEALTLALDDGFRAMESRQPCLAEFVSGELALIEGPKLSAVGYFLAVLVYLAFEEAFGDRLGRVQNADVMQTLDQLLTDGELRTRDVERVSYSEDAIALGQPALIALLRSEVDRALEAAPEDAVTERVDALYEMLLVELLALTRVVAA